MPPEAPRSSFPSTSYNMKTSARSHISHPQSRHSQASPQSLRATKSTTPMASPRMPHSVGQPYPPMSTKLASPAVADARTPSPNYFGLTVEPSQDPTETNVGPRDNWSPPTSSVRSFGAAIPKQLPLDANPEFEAFRRQADANRGTSGFNLGSSHFAAPPPAAGMMRPPRTPRWTTSDSSSELSAQKLMARRRDPSVNRMEIDSDSIRDSAYVSSESNRNSEASLHATSFFNIPKHESPAQSESPFEKRTTLSTVEDRHPRLSLPQNKLDAPSGGIKAHRGDTLPATLESGPGMMNPSELKEMIGNIPQSEYLLLDVRVSTHFSQSRIKGALNLCIPTTLLKRATFDLQKLQKTLQSEEDQGRFSKWKDTKYLVVYDGASSEKRDAVSAMNMIKKFTNEGYQGSPLILRGGFDAFAKAQPGLVDRRSSTELARSAAGSGRGSGPNFAPVIGGVTLPSAANNPNPFFSNIRQNMDLADGVGQMSISVPSSLEFSTLPQWLRDASAPTDHGKAVSDKFLHIEKNEQSRMKAAYSVQIPSSSHGNSSNTAMAHVQLSGIEKGGKNRYKDILPFEHARVKLPDRDGGQCDYINASHIKASRSNKRYIASQGPLPATFEDFWSVIWDQDVRVIVMLTAESEGGQLKCHPYWKDKGFGPIKLKSLSEKKVSLDIDKHRSNSSTTSSTATSVETGRRRANTITQIDSSTPSPQPTPSQSDSPFVIIRKFALSHASHPFAPIREITHLHYPSWPDFGAPAQPSHLLALVELANVMQRASLPVDAKAISTSVGDAQLTNMSWFDEPEGESLSRPMLVHCSAGCGRTGTFCTVDTVIDMLKRQRMTALAKNNKKRDREGDIDMDEPVSPMTSSKKPILSRGSSATSTLSEGFMRDDSELDLSWVRSQQLDLIESTVEDFRHQRLSMVQSLRQYVLCYETIIEWIWRMQQKSSAGSGRARARSGSLEA